MKIFFWLLVVANVILFAAMQMMGDSSNTQLPSPLLAEKITVVSQSAVGAPISVSAPAAVSAPASAPVVAPVVIGNCFEWGEFAGAELDRATASLKNLALGEKLSQHEVDRVIGYWVYIAPLKDKAATAQKLAQLKARGVTDYFVVQEAGEWFNAISLGLFKSQEAAQKFLQVLRSKGVNSAKMGERASKTRATVFVFSALDAQTSAKLTALQKDFASSELKSLTCH